MVMGELPEAVEVLVIGGGPGGYAAAFRAADLGHDVMLVSDEEQLGGVCLLRGCIPSKALLHLSTVIHEAADAGSMGLDFGTPDIDLKKMRKWKNGVVHGLSEGLTTLCERHGVRLEKGHARFRDAGTVHIESDTPAAVRFQNAIIATGSRPIHLPDLLPDDARILDSTTALDLEEIPDRLLVIGGGYVGLELGQVYAALGSRVTLVEMADHILPGADRDLIEPLSDALAEQFDNLLTGTQVTGVEADNKGLTATVDGPDENHELSCDRVLLSVGRKPNTDALGLDRTNVETDDSGFIVVDAQRRTADQHIFAIGDAAGGAQLAHEAMHEGCVAAEVIAGRPAAFDVRAIPAIVYTDPQIAWCGLTERDAKETKRDISVVRFPWQASGRARAMSASDGLTKLVLDAHSGRVLGLGAVGRSAESLVAEGVLAIEMGATAKDLALCVHAHPTLGETVGEAAELFLGQATHLAPKQRSANQ